MMLLPHAATYRHQDKNGHAHLRTHLHRHTQHNTLLCVFGVDVAIGSVDFEGEDVQAIVPVRLSGDK